MSDWQRTDENINWCAQMVNKCWTIDLKNNLFYKKKFDKWSFNKIMLNKLN